MKKNGDVFTRDTKMIDVWLCLFTCFNLFLTAKCSVPNEKLCVNAACTEPISKAQGSVKYISPSREMLSFRPGKEIIITSKSKNKQDYWGAVIDGKSGYVPSNLIKETQVYHSTDKLITVAVEVLQSNVTAEGSFSESSISQNNNDLSQIGAVPLKSDKPNEPANQFSPDSVPLALQEVKESLLLEKQNSGENPTDKSLESDLFIMSDLTKKETNLSPTQVYSVIEGTTVYVDGNEEEITPSPTLDLKENMQTSLLKDFNAKMNSASNDKEGNFHKNQMATNPSSDNFQINTDYKEKLILHNNKEINLESGGSKIENTQVRKTEDAEGINIRTGDINDEDDDDTDSDDDDDDVDVDDDDGDGDGDDNESDDIANGNANVNESTKTEILQNEKVMTSNFTNDFPDKMQAMKTSNQLSLENSENVLTETNGLKTSQVEDSITETSNTKKEKVDSSLETLETDTGANEKNAQVVVPNDISQILLVPSQVQQENLQTNSPNENIESPESWNMINVFNKSAHQGIVESYAPKSNGDDVTISEKSVSLQKDMPQDPGMEKNNVDEQEPETSKTETDFDQIKETDKGYEASFLLTTNSVEQVNEKIVEEITNKPESIQKDQGIFLWLTEFFLNFISSKKEVLEGNMKGQEIPGTESNPNESMERDGDLGENLKRNPLAETCENSDVNSGCSEITRDEPGLMLWNLSLSSGLPASSNTLLYLIVTAVTVLAFTLGHNFIEKKGKTGPLIAKINKLEQELLVTSKECLLLKDEIQSAKEKVVLYENSANDELVLSLQTELEEYKKIRSELESSIEVLQQELDAATEAGLDLNKMLSEVLTQKGGSETLLKSVENLQAQLDSQQKVIDEMTKKLGIKNQENEILQAALQSATEKAGSLEDELNDIKYNLNLHLKEKEDLTQHLNSQISQLQIRVNQLNESKEKEVSKVQKNAEEIQKTLRETTQMLTVKEEELKALKESVKQIKTKGNTNLERLFDVSRIKAELIKEEKENQELLKKLELEVNSKKVLEDQVKSLNHEVQALKKNYDDAEQKRDEAEKKLEVLSNYFKEKETQLQKELGLQEALWAQKMGDEKTVNSIIKSLQEEVDSYKSQNETLKKEILDQERGLKNQIAVLEQKAHENWVAARQAERKLEETKQETAQLRNRLTLMEKSVNTDVEGKANHRPSEELNGIEANSPILHDTSSPLLFPPLPMDPNNSTLLPPGFMPHPMFMPPPMGGFIPPPPFLPGDRRPPPLGRMSSPPLNSRFSPPPLPDYSFERMPSPPLSPSPRNFRSPNEADREHFRHRTPPYPPTLPKNWDDGREIPGFIPISSPRDLRRQQKGSNISSGHSSSDSLDKSSRNSGRV